MARAATRSLEMNNRTAIVLTVTDIDSAKAIANTFRKAGRAVRITRRLGIYTVVAK